MNKMKCLFFIISFTLIYASANAQVVDSISAKSNIFSQDNLPKKDTIITTSRDIALEQPIKVKIKDTTKKTSWLSKLGFPKKTNINTDSAQAVAKVAAKPIVAVVDKPIIEKPVVAVVEKPIPAKPEVEKVKDTIKKASWLSKLSFPKKTNINTDSVQAIAKVAEKPVDAVVEKPIIDKPAVAVVEKPIVEKPSEKKPIIAKPEVEKVKDTINKTSWLSKLSFSKKTNIKTDSLQAVAKVAEKPIVTVAEKVKDSIPSNLKIESVSIVKAKDSISIYKTMEQKFLKYTATTTVSLLAGANFSKQTIDAGGYPSNFNYTNSDINDDVYKSGYFGGIRLDGMLKKKHAYSLIFTFNKISTGANYTSSSRLTPVVGSFSTFKAEEHFFVLNVAAHYKKLIPYGDLKKFKFYIVGGPSFDARLSNVSLDNQVTNVYKQIFMKGDLGLEFNNQSLYTLFFHYQHNLGSLTKSPIRSNINTFQLGITIKATDLL